MVVNVMMFASPGLNHGGVGKDASALWMATAKAESMDR
jgi:hypothetical protein